MTHRAEREVEKSYYVRVINPLHYKEGIPKNACKIGIINKQAYVVLLSRDYEGNEVMKIHTLKTEEDQVVEVVEEPNVVKNLFNKMFFF